MNKCLNFSDKLSKLNSLWIHTKKHKKIMFSSMRYKSSSWTYVNNVYVLNGNQYFFFSKQKFLQNKLKTGILLRHQSNCFKSAYKQRETIRNGRSVKIFKLNVKSRKRYFIFYCTKGNLKGTSFFLLGCCSLFQYIYLCKADWFMTVRWRVMWRILTLLDHSYSCFIVGKSKFKLSCRRFDIHF